MTKVIYHLFFRIIKPSGKKSNSESDLPSVPSKSSESIEPVTTTMFPGKVTCEAIPPYDTQGLDDWCTNNCNLGYCPKTMCLCHPAD